MQDNDLILFCKRGDKASQKKFFLRHSPLLFNVSLRYARSREDAEDVLQEAWVSIFNSLEQYNESGNLIAWMKKIVINKALRNRSNNWFNTDLVEVMDLSDKISNPTIWNELENEEVLKVIDRLPIGYSEVFKLYIIEGFKHAEIADMMGIEESTSRSKLTIARRKLRELILGTSKINH